MTLQSLWRLTAPLLLSLMSCQAHADIIANFNVTTAVHSKHVNDVDVVYDDQAFTPYGGTVSSNLVKPNPKSCKIKPTTTAGHNSLCFFDSDFSAISSPLEADYLTRFTPGHLPYQAYDYLSVNLTVRDDGNYVAMFNFSNSVNNSGNDDGTGIEAGFTTNYRFYFYGTGMAATKTMDANLAASIWGGMRPVDTFYTSVWQKGMVDPLTGDYTLLESDIWEGTMELVNAAVPEPATPLLWLIGTVALAYHAQRRYQGRLAK